MSAALALPAFAQTTVNTVAEETVEYSKEKYSVVTSGPKGCRPAGLFRRR